jgi:hypothetical protein
LSLPNDAKRLFGHQIVSLAGDVDPLQVDATQIKDAAVALSLLKGDPVGQIAMIQALPTKTATELCRWVIDPQFWRKVGDVQQH